MASLIQAAAPDPAPVRALGRRWRPSEAPRWRLAPARPPPSGPPRARGHDAVGLAGVGGLELTAPRPARCGRRRPAPGTSSGSLGSSSQRSTRQQGLARVVGGAAREDRLVGRTGRVTTGGQELDRRARRGLLEGTPHSLVLPSSRRTRYANFGQCARTSSRQVAGAPGKDAGVPETSGRDQRRRAREVRLLDESRDAPQ